jgi:hypothetical protein
MVERKALVEVRRVPVFAAFLRSLDPVVTPALTFFAHGCSQSAARDCWSSPGRLATTAYQRKAAMGSAEGFLGRLSDAISVVATAANALLGAEEREGSTAGADVGDEITTLLHGVRRIKRAYEALDVAIREVRS